MRASKCSTATEKYLRQIKISERLTMRMPPGYRHKPRADLIGTMGPALPGRFALRPRLTRCFTLRMLFRDRVYKISLDGKILGGSARPGKLKNLAGFTKLRAHRKRNLVGELLNWRVQKLLLHPKK